MDVLENYYGKALFQSYGLFANVPGRRTWPRRIFVTISSTCLFLGVVYQGVKLVKEDFQMEIVIQIIPTIMTALMTLIYLLYIVFASEKEYVALLSFMIKDLRGKRSAAEDAIKRKFADEAMVFTKICTIIFGTSAFSIQLAVFYPRFLDLLVPLNETRELELIVDGECFFDQRKYFYPVYLFQCCLVMVVCCVIGVSENMSVVIGHHFCSMFPIIGYRLENVTEVEEEKSTMKIDYDRMLSERIHLCIEDHQRTLRFGVLFASYYDFPLTCILIGSFCALTFGLVHVTDSEMISTKMVFLTVIQIFQLLLLSHMGQKLIDASEELTRNAYNAKWDVCPTNVRRALQMMMLRSFKSCKVVARSIYTLSIENFMMVVQTSMSFYMVLRQAR